MTDWRANLLCGMASNSYAFLTTWKLPCSPEVAYDVLIDPLDLPSWWPDVYLSAQEVNPGDEKGCGREIALHTKGWLPYTLKWILIGDSSRDGEEIRIRAAGDFEGTGVWSFHPSPNGCTASFEWVIRAEKPLLKWLSWLLKPAFEANHRWAMKKGHERILQELRVRGTVPVSSVVAPLASD